MQTRFTVLVLCTDEAFAGEGKRALAPAWKLGRSKNF